MTDECAQKMLADLKEHFGQPVLPLHDFCAAISTWMRCIEQGNADNPGGRQQGSEYWKELGRIEMDISKSCLLWRLLYSGEPVRKTKCPKHNGHMDTHLWAMGGTSPVVMLGVVDGKVEEFIRTDGCPYGCGGSGWLKEPR